MEYRFVDTTKEKERSTSEKLQGICGDAINLIYSSTDSIDDRLEALEGIAHHVNIISDILRNKVKNSASDAIQKYHSGTGSGHHHITSHHVDLAKWLGSGLQNPLHRFDASTRHHTQEPYVLALTSSNYLVLVNLVK